VNGQDRNRRWAVGLGSGHGLSGALFEFGISAGLGRIGGAISHSLSHHLPIARQMCLSDKTCLSKNISGGG